MLGILKTRKPRRHDSRLIGYQIPIVVTCEDQMRRFDVEDSPIDR